MITENQLTEALQTIVINETAARLYDDACRVLLDYVIEHNEDGDEADLVQKCGQMVLQYQLYILEKSGHISCEIGEDGVGYRLSENDNPKTLEEIEKEILDRKVGFGNNE